MRVALTPDEMNFLGSAGVARCVNALDMGRGGAHGFNRFMERWQIDVEGVLTEGAAAKALGLLYEPVVGMLDTNLGDIGPGLQVRGTKYSSGRLLIHDSDHDDHIFILVTGIYGVYDIRGWIFAREGKKQENWKTHKGRGAYWVEQTDLRPIETLELPEAA